MFQPIDEQTDSPRSKSKQTFIAKSPIPRIDADFDSVQSHQRACTSLSMGDHIPWCAGWTLCPANSSALSLDLANNSNIDDNPRRMVSDRWTRAGIPFSVHRHRRWNWFFGCNHVRRVCFDRRSKRKEKLHVLESLLTGEWHRFGANYFWLSIDRINEIFWWFFFHTNILTQTKFKEIATPFSLE